MLSGSLSENILCLLAYNDIYAKIIRSTIPLNLWSGPNRILASKVYGFIDQFKVPPKDHLPDLISDKLEKEGPEAEIYTRLVMGIREAQAHINVDYVSHQLQLFVERQSLRSVTVELTKALQADTEESIDHARLLIQKARRQQLKVFDPGLRLSDKTQALNFLDIGNDAFPTGIPELDKRGFGPTRKELTALIADAKAGKSFFLIQLAKIAIIHRIKVVHITLEMSEDRVSQRYFQTLYGVAKRPDDPNDKPTQKLIKDDFGRLTDLKEIRPGSKLRLSDHDIRQKLESFIDRDKNRHLSNIFIKEFPTGSLTVRELEGYLDNLEATEKFTPDLLIIDYPDLMKLDKNNLRLSLDELYKEIRGLCVVRNIAGAVVSQSNRLGSKAKLVDTENVAEAYSKIQHVDLALTLSATTAEKRLGLARLYVAAGRNDESNLMIVISQHYKTGLFALDSALMSLNYWSQLPTEAEE